MTLDAYRIRDWMGPRAGLHVLEKIIFFCPGQDSNPASSSRWASRPGALLRGANKKKNWDTPTELNVSRWGHSIKSRTGNKGSSVDLVADSGLDNELAWIPEGGETNCRLIQRSQQLSIQVTLEAPFLEVNWLQHGTAYTTYCSAQVYAAWRYTSAPTHVFAQLRRGTYYVTKNNSLQKWRKK
jgi:hypothetical protein